MKRIDKEKLFLNYAQTEINPTYYNSKTGTSLHESIEGGTSYIAIKGSDFDGWDWTRNILPILIQLTLAVLSIYFPLYGIPAFIFGMVHFGWFALGIEAVKNISLKNKNYKLLGFSLGGAGVICLATILILLGKKVEVITCGSPRPYHVFSIFNLPLLFCKITHYVNRPDPVCRVMPAWLGYWNYGRRVKSQRGVQLEGLGHNIDDYKKLVISDNKK